MVKLSIVIPIYNVEKYLDKCVQSARNQTLKDVEIILVDDESPDRCPQMCDEYARQDSRIKVVHKTNGGLGFARNSGLEVATGEFVTFLDSDDFVDLCAYEHLYNLVKRHSLDVIYYKFKRFANEADVVADRITDNITQYSDEGIRGLMLDIIASEPSAKVDHLIACSSCTAMYRLSIIKNHNIRFHSERELISEDLIYNLDYLRYASKVAYNDGEYYHYRINPVSLTSTVRTDRIKQNLLLYEFIKRNIHAWGLDIIKGNERNARLFIGNARSSIKHILTSAYKEKRQWLIDSLSLSIWRELFTSYEWRKLPFYCKIYFFSCCKKYKIIIFLLSKI